MRPFAAVTFGGEALPPSSPMKSLIASLAVVTTLLSASGLQAQAPATPPASYMMCMACHGMDGKGMGAGTPAVIKIGDDVIQSYSAKGLSAADAKATRSPLFRQV